MTENINLPSEKDEIPPGCGRRLSHNPLLQAVGKVLGRIFDFRAKVKEYYFEVLLSSYRCPECNGRLQMVGQSQCCCSVGHVLDPSLAFQQSPCCNTRLIRKTFHYACSSCHQTVPSKFLFDERLFDREYFREMMRDARARDKRKKEELKVLLAGSRSDTLILLEEPCLDSLPGLTEALNGFIGTGDSRIQGFLSRSGFSLEDYRRHLLSVIGKGSMLFSDIAPLVEDWRKDKIWRFVTLIFMRQDREVSLTQYGADILVERIAE